MKVIILTVVIIVIIPLACISSKAIYHNGWIDKCIDDTEYLVGSGKSPCECMYLHRSSVIDARTNDINTANCLEY